MSVIIGNDINNNKQLILIIIIDCPLEFSNSRVFFLGMYQHKNHQMIPIEKSTDSDLTKGLWRGECDHRIYLYGAVQRCTRLIIAGLWQAALASRSQLCSISTHIMCSVCELQAQMCFVFVCRQFHHSAAIHSDILNMLWSLKKGDFVFRRDVFVEKR